MVSQSEPSLDILYGDERDEKMKMMREKAEAFFEQAGVEPLEIYRIE